MNKFMNAEEKVLILYWGNPAKYSVIEYNFKEVFTDVLKKYQRDGFIMEETTEDKVELTENGLKLFEEVKSSMNELTELDCIILDYLSLKTEDEPVHDIFHELIDKLRFYGKDEVFYEINWLKFCGYVDFFDEFNDYFKTTWLVITDEGRKALRQEYSHEVSLNCNTLFTNENGIKESRDMWLLLVAAEARKKHFDNLPDFVEWAFSNFEVHFDKEECTRKLQENLKKQPWSAISDQISMQKFINDFRSQTNVREKDLRRANAIFVAIKDKIFGEN